MEYIGTYPAVNDLPMLAASQGINNLLFISGDNEVNVVDVYDDFLHCHNLEYNYDCITLYSTSSHKSDHSARFYS